MNAADEQQVTAWVAEALRRIEAGEPPRLDELCKARPDLLPEVQAALGLCEQLPAMHRQQPLANPPHGHLLAERYLLLERIGSGAAGAVWRANDERLHREVAVKLLHDGLFAGFDAEQRFHREAVVLAGYEHRHIVRIYDQGQTEDGTSFLVTELLRGTSLQDVLQGAQRAMPDGPSLARFTDTAWLQELLPEAELESNWLRQAVRWVAELGDGLAAAHADDVCHRDVKPSNAFVRHTGTAVLLDFGIAARTGDASITRTHAVLGTPSYMAPEQAAGDSAPRAALDVYGLTATLYHLVTLRPPHAGDLQQVLVALRRDDPERAGKLCPGLPRDLQAILDRGLERRPDKRYRTMNELVCDLRAFLDHAPVQARPLSPFTRTLRRIARRPARSVAIGSTAIAAIAVTVGTLALGDLDALAAERRWRAGHARLAADLCIEGYPDMRPLVPVDEQRSQQRELDALIEIDGRIDERDLGLLLLRAASALDSGDAARACADLATVSELAPSAYTGELARRYATAAPGPNGRLVPDLRDLPAPQTSQDHFLAGFHALRARDCERADELLGKAPDYLPAQDLRLLAILGLKQKDPQRAIAAAARLEGIYGYPTARTQHTLAAAHLQQGLFEQAIPYCEQSLRLRPDRHGPWTNLGFANLRLGRLSEALRCYQRAVELRPWLPNSLSGLAQTQRALGRYDDAEATAARILDDGWREYELGALALARALHALRADDREALARHAREAHRHFELSAADADSQNPKRGSLRGQLMLAQVLADGRRERALAPLLFGIRSDPRNPRSIANLSVLLGDAPLDADSRNRLRLWLLDLAIDLSPEDPEFRRLRRELIESLTGKDQTRQPR